MARHLLTHDKSVTSDILRYVHTYIGIRSFGLKVFMKHGNLNVFSFITIGKTRLFPSPL